VASSDEVERAIEQQAGKSSENTSQPAAGAKKEMSPKQWNFIKNIGAGLRDPYTPLSESEVVDLVKWKAEQLGVAPRSIVVADAFLPRKNEDIKPWEKFGNVLDEYLENIERAAMKDTIPVFDENGNEVRL